MFEQVSPGPRPGRHSHRRNVRPHASPARAHTGYDPDPDDGDGEDAHARRRPDQGNGSSRDRAPDAEEAFRLWEEDHLDLEIRQAIVEAARRRPGSNKSQLAEAVGEKRGTVAFHIDRLVEDGVLVTREAVRGRQVHCFVPEDMDLWRDERTRILFGNSALRAVAQYVLDHPAADTAQIAEAVGKAMGTIRAHLKTLRDNGLVARRRFDNQWHQRPLPPLKAWKAMAGDRLARWDG